MSEDARSEIDPSEMPLRGLIVLAVLSGILVGLGQAPFGFWPIAILGLSGAAWLFRLSDTGRRAFVIGVRMAAAIIF